MRYLSFFESMETHCPAKTSSARNHRLLQWLYFLPRTAGQLGHHITLHDIMLLTTITSINIGNVDSVKFVGFGHATAFETTTTRPTRIRRQIDLGILQTRHGKSRHENIPAMLFCSQIARMSTLRGQNAAK